MKKISSYKPLVSVIMPVHNAERFVSQAIESILAQSYRHFELIIIDDASKDNSWKAIASYARNYPKQIIAKRLKKNVNRGGDAAANIGFTLAKGEFLARMDADDIALPNRLEKQVSFFKKHPKVDLVGGQATLINDQNQEIGRKTVPTAHSVIKKEFFGVHPIIHPTVMMRRSALLNPQKMYQDELNSNNDYHTFYLMIAQGRTFANVSSDVLLYRLHDTNDSLRNLKRTFWNTLKTRIRVVTTHGVRPSFADVLKLVIQLGLVSILPEKILQRVYTMLRGWSLYQKPAALA